MGALIRAHDWSSTTLGPPHVWPSLLRTSLSTLLKSKHPMFLAWGPDLLYFYNDAHRPLLGLKHPAVLGRPLAESSASFWSVIRPLVNQALSGEGTWSEDLPLVTFRSGREETAYFTFSFSPVTDEAGAVAGLFCVGTETTARVQAEASLRASEERLRSVLQQAPGFMAVLQGPEHVFEMANEAFQRLVGLRPLIGKPVREALPEFVEQGFLDPLDQVYATGQSYTTGGTRVLLDPEPGGTPRERHVGFTCQPILERNGPVTGILVQGHDITEQKEIADAQRRREMVLNTALQAGRSVVLEADLVTGASNRSDTAIEFLGLRPGPVSDLVKWVHPDDQARLAQARSDARTKGRAETEVRYQHPDGRMLWVIVRLQAHFDDKGTPIRIYGLVTDLTDRKQAEAQIAFQARLLDAVEQAVMATDPAGRIIYYNKFAETLYGWSVEEAMGRHVVELCSGGDPDDAAARLASLVQGGSWSGEFLAKHKDGSTFPAYVTDSPIYDGSGCQIGIVSVSHDIRKQKQVEAEIREKTALLETTLENMDQGLMVMDAAERVSLFNKRVLDLLDLPLALMEGHPLVEQVKDYQEWRGEFAPQDRDGFHPDRGNGSRHAQRVYERAGPNGLIIEFRTVPLPDGGAVRTYTDVTARRQAEAELRTSEARYRALVEASASIIWRAAPDGSIIEGWGWATDVGQGSEAYQDFGWIESVHPEDRRNLLDLLQGFAAGGQACVNEYRVRHQDGTYRWVCVRGVPLRNADGTVQEWVGTVTDIHDQKLAADRLRDSEERHRALVMATSSILWSATPDGTIFDITGFEPYFASKEPLLGYGWLDLVHPDDREALIANGQAVIASGMPAEKEFRFRFSDGEYRWVCTRSAPLKNADGTVREWIGTLIDVHEKKQAHEALRQSREDLHAALEANRTILEHSLDVICTVDESGAFTQVSPHAERVWGYTPEELTGRRYIELVHPEDVERSKAIAALITSGAPTSAFENRFLRKDGAVVPLLWSMVWSDEHKMMFCVARDLTERLQTEERLRQSQKMEAVGQLTGGIAHDFNNLLTVILGNAEILAEDPTDPAQTQDLSKIILETAERGAELTQHLLAFGRRQTLNPVPLCLDDIVHGMLALLQRSIGEHITLRTECVSSRLSALADRTLLESAILNLIVNARDAMPRGGTLTLSTGQRAANPDEGLLVAGQDVVFVTVTDTGTGMSPEVQKRVFEPFFTTKEVGKGSGLGLSMVYGFAQQSGGHVSLTSAPGQGTSATIVLPAVVSNEMSAVGHADAPPARRGHERVLVVEDEAAVLQFLTAQLSSLGYDVTAVADAPDALAVLSRDRQVRLLLTDIVLPKGISGVELARTARQINSHLKVLYTSGYSEEAFRQQGGSDEGIPLLRKPYRRKDLAEALRVALE
ncbi:MAG TPA: PAS domain S-box protein [Microvirga sp.]|nr:PAS domain S-box protein [Microvirga sp.]